MPGFAWCWDRPIDHEAPVSVRFVRAYDLDHPGGHRIASHLHAEWELLLVEAGVYRCTINRRPIVAPAPALVILAPGDRHRDTTDGPVRISSVHLETRAAVPIGLAGQPGHQQAMALGRDSPVAEAIRRVVVDARQEGAVTAWLLDALAAEVFWRAIALLPVRRLSAGLRRAVAVERFSTQVVRLIGASLAKPPAIAALARAVNLGERQFRDRCRREFGCAPGHLVAQTRIHHARLLLGRPRATVAGVAEQLGFATPEHFSRVYRRVRGRPPSDDLGSTGDQELSREGA
jgi:AraC-like DNA-binding protein